MTPFHRRTADGWADSLFTREGLALVTKEGAAIREVFGQYEWYDPIPGLTVEEAAQTMSAVEAENIKTLAAERNRKKQ